MNLKALRTVHLYLGCFFAPLLIFLVVTGCCQIFALHEQPKGAPFSARVEFFDRLSRVHMKGGKEKGQAPVSFRMVVLAMTLGFVVTTALGVWMAFRFAQTPSAVWLCLASGGLITLWFVAKAFGVE